MIKLVIAQYRPASLEGYQASIHAREPEITLAGIAHNHEELMTAVHRVHPPDVLLILSIERGQKAEARSLRSIKRKYPDIEGRRMEHEQK